ncbi:MAG: hypothetical protein KME27_08215 [Lyngbya sp. HA4199-MV5]|jgi:hypothetical protein|nr:hypothetical protein [Lyngbya sp. HA4199-MV5]
MLATSRFFGLSAETTEPLRLLRCYDAFEIGGAIDYCAASDRAQPVSISMLHRAVLHRVLGTCLSEAHGERVAGSVVQSTVIGFGAVMKLSA